VTARYSFPVRLAAVLLLVATGCSSPSDSAAVDSSTGEASASACSFACFDASIDAPLALRIGGLLSGCAGDDCHNRGQGNLLISGANDFSALIDARSSEMPGLFRVQPGDPAQSYVYRKLACEGGTVGDCMPKLRPEPWIAQLFHDWIEAGAPTQ
jgi:hypothetical protein